MFLPTDKERELKQKSFYHQCQQEINRLLCFGDEHFDALFPNSIVRANINGNESKWLTREVIGYKHHKIENWVSCILDEAMNISNGGEYELPSPTPRIPSVIGDLILDTCLRIQTYGRDLTDIDYYFLSEVGSALHLQTEDIYCRIEQALYEVRKDIFNHLKPLLSKSQRETCAGLLLNAIQADNKVHPAEIKYFEIISNLLDNNQTDIEQIEHGPINLDNDLLVAFPKEIAEFLFRYLVEIVMCDKQFDPDESRFIKDMGRAFKLDSVRQDEILQPIAAALMVKTDLFS
jgi:hypothetical protein